MSDLLKKRNKSSSLKRPPDVKPERTFDIHSLNAEEEKKPAPAPKSKKAVNTSTTVRVSKELKNKLNALVTIGVADNVDMAIEIMMDEYVEAILDKDEKKQFEILQKIYRDKQNRT